jgi:hypothetical protein
LYGMDQTDSPRSTMYLLNNPTLTFREHNEFVSIDRRFDVQCRCKNSIRQ